jgi:glyoxylase-like metal-dependent hydrolase (beta-lactamase superfamily II)
LPPQIQTIPLALPYRMGSVNCFLVRTGRGYVLVDTGGSNVRAALERALAGAGCTPARKPGQTPGQLELVVLTHGDFDHAGNAAYLRERYGARLAMHAGDVGMVERGDMFSNRTSGGTLMRWLAPLLARLLGFGKRERFTPDLLVEDGTDLAAHGFEARVLSMPGHSAGSIALLTAQGDLFCGDLLENTKGPAVGGMPDDPAAARASLDRLVGLNVKTVYPGHGEPFPMHEFLATEGAEVDP